MAIIAAVLIGGVLLGCTLANIIFRFRSSGNLKVVTSDPEDGPYLFMELKDTSNLIHGRYITFKVVVTNVDSHE